MGKFKVGDEVICVWSGQFESLVDGEIYIVGSSEAIDAVRIRHINDRLFMASRFIPNTPEGKAEYMRRIMEDG